MDDIVLPSSGRILKLQHLAIVFLCHEMAQGLEKEEKKQAGLMKNKNKSFKVTNLQKLLELHVVSVK